MNSDTVLNGDLNSASNVYLNEMLDLELNEMLITISDSSIDYEIKKKIDFIEHEIDIRVESIILELHKIRDELKEKLKDNMQRIQSCEIFSSLREIILNFSLKNEVNQSLIDKKQDVLNECQDALKNFRNHLNEMKFIHGKETVDTDMVGKLTKPFIHCNKIKKTDDIYLNAKELRRAVILTNQNKLVITDWKGACLKIIDFINNKNKLDTFYHEEIKKPWAICIDKQQNIYISEHATEKEVKVLVFSSKFEFIRKFDISIAIGLASIIIDLTNTSQIQYMYISQWNQNKITVYQANTGEYLTSISISSPSFTRFNQKYMCTVSFTDYTLTKDSCKFDEIINGSNCVYLIDKITYQILNKIKFDDWLQPYGLMFDECSNIFTTALEYDASKNISYSRYLFMFDKNSKILKKLKIDSLNTDSDIYYTMLIYDNQLAVIFNNSIKFFEFE